MTIEKADVESEPLPCTSSGSRSAISETTPRSNRDRAAAAVRPLGLVAVIDALATTPTDLGRRYAEETGLASPSRRARRSSSNGVVRFAGEKMPATEEAESVTLEYSLALELDHDQRVKRFNFQPQRISLDYVNANGRHVRTRYTPDCLIELVDGRMALVEMKPVETAEKECAARNPRFSWNADLKRYVDKPFSAACAGLGIAPIIATDADINYIYIGNLLFLGKGFRTAWVATPGVSALVEHLYSIGSSKYFDLARSPQGWTTDDLVGAIVHEHVYVDLRKERLQPYGLADVYPSRKIFELAAQTRTAADSKPVCATPAEPFRLDLSKTSDAALQEAWRRWDLIKSVVRGADCESTLSSMAKRYLRRYRLQHAADNVGFAALIPDYSSRGFTGSHLDERVEELLVAEVGAVATNEVLQVGTYGYGKLILRCREEGLPPPSRQTYQCRLRAEKSKPAAIKAASGSEGVYQKRPASPFSISTISRIAKRAFSLGVIDHTPLPIRLIESVFGTPIEGLSPWLTYMRDDATDMALGMALSWGRPTTRSILSVLWDCYRQFGRVAEGVMLDGESAHDSVAVEKVLAFLTTDKIARRFLKPRDGRGVERDFSRMMHGLLCYLSGNYVLRQNPSEWPRGWNPAQMAERTIGSLFTAVRTFLFDYCNTQLGRASLGGLTPIDAMQASLRMHGERGFRVHADIRQSRHILLPLTPKAPLKFDRQTGVRPFGQSYLPVVPVDPVFYKTPVAVRYDPFDIRYVLARLGNQWTELRHRHAERFEGMSADHLAAISTEIRETQARYERKSPERAEDFAKFLNQALTATKDPLAELLKSAAPANEPVAVVNESIWSRARSEAGSKSKTYFEATS